VKFIIFLSLFIEIVMICFGGSLMFSAASYYAVSARYGRQLIKVPVCKI